MKYWLPISFLLWFAVLASCEKPVVTVESGSLSFSADTVKFDSIFLNFQTPSERLFATNNTNKNISISRIWLEGGDNSEFSLVVDGVRADDVKDKVIAKNDSILLFVSLTSELQDDFAEDYIAFQIGDEIQRILVRAFVVDAYLLKARLSGTGVQGFVFTKDTVLNGDKPIIMDGPIIIDQGVTVQLSAGTELFFTPYKYEIDNQDGTSSFVLFSSLIVQGSLKVEGTAESPVVFQGSRLDLDYQENPGQWRGIRFTQSSQNNVMRHALVKNALIGVEVDSVVFGRNPRLLMQYSEVRNMAAYGILGFGFSVDGLGNAPALVMENCLVHTNQRNVVILGGGNYEFYNCTFDNSVIFGRRDPQVLINNYAVFDNTAFIYPSRSIFTNTAIWGQGEINGNEIELDFLPDGPLSDLLFDHSLIQYDTENEIDISPFLLNSLLNQNPEYRNPFQMDYRLKDDSPLIDAGKDLSNRYVADFRNSPDSLRTPPYDIGAFELIKE